MHNHKDEKTLDILNNLINNLKETETSYRAAAENIHDENLKQVFIIYAYQKAEYAAKLQSEVRRLGGTVTYNGTDNENSGFLRGLNEEPAEILNNCEKHEAKAIFNYERAMNEEDILWEVIPIVSRQYLETRESYNQIKYIKSNYNEAFAQF